MGELNETYLSSNISMELNISNNSTSNGPCALQEIFQRYQCIMLEHVPIAVYIDRCITPFWYLLGFVGNFIAFYIWTKRHRRHPNISSLYLAVLAITDNLLLISHIATELHFTWGLPSIDYKIFCPLYFVVFMSLQYASPLLILGFTIERYISITQPFRSERFSRIQRGPLEICALSVVAVLLGVPQLFGWNMSTGHCDGSDNKFYKIWSWVSDTLVFVVFPVMSLILNILVLRAASKSVKFRRQPESSYLKRSCTHSGRISKTNSALVSPSTATLLTISFYRLLTLIPVAIIFALQFSYPVGSFDIPVENMDDDPKWRKHFNWLIAKKVIDEIGLSQYCCNVLIYLVTSKPFRLEIQRCLGCHVKRSSNIPMESMHGDTINTTHATLLDPSQMKEVS